MVNEDGKSNFIYFQDEEETKEFCKALKKIIHKKESYRLSMPDIFFKVTQLLEDNPKVKRLPSYPTFARWTKELKTGEIDNYLRSDRKGKTFFRLYFGTWTKAFDLWRTYLFNKYESVKFPARWEWLIERKFRREWHLPSRMQISGDNSGDPIKTETKLNITFSGAKPFTSEKDVILSDDAN